MIRFVYFLSLTIGMGACQQDFKPCRHNQHLRWNVTPLTTKKLCRIILKNHDHLNHWIEQKRGHNSSFASRENFYFIFAFGWTCVTLMKYFFSFVAWNVCHVLSKFGDNKNNGNNSFQKTWQSQDPRLKCLTTDKIKQLSNYYLDFSLTLW